MSDKRYVMALLACLVGHFVSGCATLTLVVPPEQAPAHAAVPAVQAPLPAQAAPQPLPERAHAPLVQEGSGAKQDMGVLVEFVEGQPSELDVCQFEPNEDGVLAGKCISYKKLEAGMKARDLKRSDL